MDRQLTESANLKWARMLSLTVAVALLIRVWGIDHGLPYIYWIDEYHEVMRVMELGSGSLNLSRTGKGGFYFLLFVEYGLYYVVLRLAGVVSTLQRRNFAELFVRDPTVFNLMGIRRKPQFEERDFVRDLRR